MEGERERGEREREKEVIGRKRNIHKWMDGWMVR
jgi:hypothetical protein